MKLMKCTSDHIPILAQMNKELFEDEKNDTIPSIDILEKRLNYLIEHDSVAYLFLEESEIAGYALIKNQLVPNYLSHFFISKNMRRKHLGTIAFNLLMEELNTDSIDLDVFCWNERGQEFWKSLGFQERCIIMRKYK